MWRIVATKSDSFSDSLVTTCDSFDNFVTVLWLCALKGVLNKYFDLTTFNCKSKLVNISLIFYCYFKPTFLRVHILLEMLSYLTTTIVDIFGIILFYNLKCLVCRQILKRCSLMVALFFVLTLLRNISFCFLFCFRLEVNNFSAHI